MILTVRYDYMSDADFGYLRDNLARHKAKFFRINGSLTVEAEGDMSRMIEVMKIIAKYKHQSLTMR